MACGLHFVCQPLPAWSQATDVFLASEGVIVRAASDGSNPTIVTELPLTTIFLRVAIARGLGKIYSTHACLNCFTTTLARSNLDGSDFQTILQKDLDSYFIGIAIDAPEEYVYWTSADSGGMIQRAKTDGSNIQTVLTSAGNNLFGLEVDSANGVIYIYWTTHDDGIAASGRILRANLDGGAREVVLSGLDTPTDVALDVGADKIYWTEYSAGRIRRARMHDGADVETVLTGANGPNALAVDLQAGMLYWACRSGEVFRAMLDGSSVERIASDWNGVNGLDLLTPSSAVHEATWTGVRSMYR